MLALLAFGILPTDSAETIETKITNKIAYLNRHSENEPELYLKLIAKFRLVILDKKNFDSFFVNQQEKELFTKIAQEKPQIFKLTLEQLYLLSRLFKEECLTTKQFLVLAQHPNFTYENLEFYKPTENWFQLFSLHCYHALLFTLPEEKHLAVVFAMKEIAIQELIQRGYLKIRHLMEYVLAIPKEKNETMPQYVARIGRNMTQWRSSSLTDFDWKFMQLFFNEAYGFKPHPNLLKLLIITSGPLALRFYRINVFSISEFLLFAARYKEDPEFIFAVLQLLNSCFKQDIALPKKLRLKSELKEIWHKTDKQLAGYITQIEENRTWLLRYPLAKTLLLAFKSTLYIDTVKKYEEDLELLADFLDLMNEPDLASFLSLSSVDINEILEKRTMCELKLFYQMLLNPVIEQKFSIGKICPEFLLYIDPHYILFNSQLEFFLSFPQLADSNFVKKIIENVAQHEDVLEAETPAHRGLAERRLFTIEIYQALNNIFYHEVKSLISIVKTHGSLFKQPAMISSPATEAKVEPTMRYSYGPTD